MAFRRPVLDVMRERSSWRTYEPEPLAEPDRESLNAALAEPPNTPFGGRVKLDLLTDFDARSRGVEKLGTYGMIKGARNYLVGRVEQADRAMEDFGFTFEWAVLVASDLGLGTCWLGGTFKRGAFARAVGAKRDEIIPAVSPVGRAVVRRRLVDRMVRWGAGSKNRKPPQELFFHGDLSRPAPLADLGELGLVLEMVRLAPSASNKQPWRVVVQGDGERLDLFLQRNKGYDRFTSVDLQRIDMGIAMCHLTLSAQELGLAGHWVDSPAVAIPAPEGVEYVASWLSE